MIKEMNKEKLTKIIETLVIKHSNKKNESNIDNNIGLIKAGILDSYSLVELVQSLDDELDIVFDYGLIKEENFYSIEKIVSFLNERYKFY